MFSYLKRSVECRGSGTFGRLRQPPNTAVERTVERSWCGGISYLLLLTFTVSWLRIESWHWFRQVVGEYHLTQEGGVAIGAQNLWCLQSTQETGVGAVTRELYCVAC